MNTDDLDAIEVKYKNGPWEIFTARSELDGRVWLVLHHQDIAALVAEVHPLRAALAEAIETCVNEGAWAAELAMRRALEK